MHNPRHNSPVSMLWHKHRLTALAIIVAAGTLVTTALATTDHHRSAARRRAAASFGCSRIPSRQWASASAVDPWADSASPRLSCASAYFGSSSSALRHSRLA